MTRILYFSTDTALCTRFVTSLTGSEPPLPTEQGYPLPDDVWLIPVHTLPDALSRLRERYVSGVILDAREGGEALRQVVALIDALDHQTDLEARYGFHRIVVLLPNRPGTDDALLDLGARGIRHALRHTPSDDSTVFDRAAFDHTLRLIQSRTAGRRALCASGGGITGLYFELGALKCLADSLGHAAVQSFDMYYGISAGAVVTGLIAAGYTVDEIMAAIAGEKGGRIPSMNLTLLSWQHVNYPDIARRLQAGIRSALEALLTTVRGGRKPSINALFLEYTALVGAPFRSDHFEHMLREILTAPGATNHFRELGSKLFIGASDQDSKRHVLFGSAGFDHIPISQAIQASLSVNPAFSAVPIEGRYYEDGAVTRTSDFVDAIQRDARLIFILDPFVPYVSRRVGSTHERGMLYNIDQDIRTMTYTRFESTRNWVLRQHPEVSSYTFLPSNRLRRLLSINPMDHRPYLQIWRGAYLSTLKRLEAVCHRLRGDLAVHGIALELERARTVAKRLKAHPLPLFHDFFPDGEVELVTSVNGPA